MTRDEKLAALRDALDVVYGTVADLIPADSPRMKLAPVTYFYPTPARVANEWARVRASAQLCIANPSSGTGTVADVSYAAEIDRCVAAGLTVLGYDDCTYGARPIVEVVAEAHRLWQHYPKLHGIFLDEVSTADTQANRDYLMAVKSAAKAHGGLLFLNPGTACPEWFMDAADAVMIAETSSAKYMARTFPDWVRRYDASRFYHCVHDCTKSEMPAVLERMRANNAGYVYVTDGPYSALPTYFTNLVEAISAQ